MCDNGGANWTFGYVQLGGPCGKYNENNNNKRPKILTESRKISIAYNKVGIIKKTRTHMQETKRQFQLAINVMESFLIHLIVLFVFFSISFALVEIILA